MEEKIGNELKTKSPASNKTTITISGIDEKTWAVLCHVTTFAGHAVPFGNIIGPLIIWLLKRQEMPWVDEQGKEALNFQITISIFFIISFVLVFLLVGFLLLPVVFLLDLIFVILAIVKTAQGEHYHYPLSIKFIK